MGKFSEVVKLVSGSSSPDLFKKENPFLTGIGLDSLAIMDSRAFVSSAAVVGLVVVEDEVARFLSLLNRFSGFSRERNRLLAGAGCEAAV